MSTKEHPHETQMGKLLWDADYRHDGKQWRLDYNSQGCGLTAHEQEANRSGGMKCGRSSRALLEEELRNREHWLSDTDPEDDAYDFWADWVKEAKSALGELATAQQP